ncbi:MAG: SusC/RagA family TonB-linked outer membrane protein [Chitinophagaceae bacterium]
MISKLNRALTTHGASVAYLLLFLAICSPKILLAETGEPSGFSAIIKNEASFTGLPIFQVITGQVKDAKNAPLQGVTVIVKGTKTGTSTGADGRFTLKDAPDQGILVISSAGFATQELPISANGVVMEITLAEQASALNEVVVVGYGTVQRKDVTGAVSQIKVTQLENENPANVTDALRGNVPGLQISQTNNSGAKGGGDLQVRGKSTITAGSTPLIVLDGVIYPGSLSDINPNDIATIDVLKDASSAAVFGAKSASGVVLITTKRGTKAKPTITLNSNVGYGELAINEPLYDGPGFVAWRTDVLNSINVNHKPFEFNDPSKLPSNISIDQWKAYQNSVGDPTDIWLTRLKLLGIERENYKKGKTTDWYNLMFQKGFRQDHTLSVSGKNENVSYYFSGGYTNNKGIIIGDDYQILRLRLNLEAKVAKFMSVGLNMQFSDRDESQVPYSWAQMVNASPYGEIYRADGVTLRDSPNDDIGNNTNPFLDNTYVNRLQRYNTLFGSIYAKGDLGYGFSYQVNFTPNFEFYRFFNGQSARDFRVSVRGGLAERTTQTSYNWQVDNLLKWNRSFGEHSFDVTLLANAEKFQSWRQQMNNEGFTPNDRLSYHNIGAGIKPIISSDDQYSTGDALMARLNYSFKQRYMLTASIRRDGYSAFGQGNPRATFPAVAVGWVFSEEKMLQSFEWLNYGKLRASFGFNGNRDIGRYLALSDLSTGKYQYITPSGAILPVAQLFVNRQSNPGLKWEKTEAVNFGLDFAVMNNRLTGSIDVYQKQTKDLLITRELPDVSGFSNVLSNLGQVDNKGIEVALTSTNISQQNFSWRTTVNFSLNRNKIVHLYGPVDVTDPVTGRVTQVERDDIQNRRFIGRDIDAIWDQKVLGVWQSNEAAEAAKYGVFPGDFKVEDVNKDGKYTNDDRQFLGFRSPRFLWTLRNEFTIFKNFDFSFMLYSSWGAKTDFNQAKNNSGFIDRQNSYKFPYWTPENPINNFSRLFSSNGSAGYSVYRKANFIRLNTVALGYTVPKAMLQRAKIESLKIYANVTNAAIYQPDWTFWDVEYRNRDNNNNISTAIPPRYYSLGLNLTF